MTTEAYRKKISQALLDLDSTPLLRKFPFDWKALTLALSHKLETKELFLETKETSWETKEALLKKFSGSLEVLAFSMAPLEGKIYWLIDKKDLSSALSSLARFNAKELVSPTLQEGIIRYLALHVLSSIQSMKEMKGFSLKLLQDSSLEDHAYLCRNLSITLNNQSYPSELIFSKAFQMSLDRHLSSSAALLEDLWEKNTDILVRLEAGKVFLKLEELERLEPGDFVLLDKKYYDVKAQKSLARFVVGDTQLFLAKIKNEKIKLLDYATIEENTMQDEGKMDEEIFEEEPMGNEENGEDISNEAVPVKEKATSLKEIPISLVAELGRFHMPLQKLLELQPGNFLPLAVPPEQNVNLTINGKIVGKAELVYLGEALGLRIMEIEK